MQFDETYKAENKGMLRRQMGALAVLFLFLCLSMCVVPGLQIIRPEKTRFDSSRLESVEYNCNYISLPEQFDFVEKTSSISEAKAAVFYKYKTARSFEELAPYFVYWFSSDDWERVSDESLIFQSKKYTLKKYTVKIENVDFPHYNYVITCAETD